MRLRRIAELIVRPFRMRYFANVLVIVGVVALAFGLSSCEGSDSAWETRGQRSTVAILGGAASFAVAAYLYGRSKKTNDNDSA